ncbi:hypothetical protein [Candidatus Nitrososphaera gargensis]|uniref:hypothetical protein n=1 Tax=Candidatus Nitrososphaera gargensis TaxID=497727 RepID=UPI00164FE20D|nr:hypothetical protein [Candidatus Nitrososphaera gargensis]
MKKENSILLEKLNSSLLAIQSHHCIYGSDRRSGQLRINSKTAIPLLPEKIIVLKRMRIRRRGRKKKEDNNND